MNKLTFGICISIMLASFTNVILAAEEYLSPAALVADSRGETLYIAEATAKQIAVFDTELAKVTATIDVPAEPTGLALSSDGAYLYVACAAPEGCVCIIETQTGKIFQQIPAGYGARCPLLSPDGKMLYICNRFNDSVSAINTKGYKHAAKTGVLREPFAADITPDGKWLFVGNHLPDGPADAESVACKVSVIDTRTMEIDASISLPNGSTGLNGVAASADGKYVYVSHILGRYTVPTTQLERGWINTNALSIFDVASKELFDTVLLDDVDNGAASPWAVRCTSDGSYILVTHAGTDELSIIDAPTLLKKIRNYHSNERKAQEQSVNKDEYGGYGSTPSSNIPNELSFLYGIRKRIKLCGKGPRALAVVDSNVYVAEYFTDSITKVNFSNSSRPETTAIPLGQKPKISVRRRGEMLFNDASICFQNWLSCASCHPGEARTDALNWDLLNDGIGNPKNTKSLLLSHVTPPAMITGVRENAEMAVRSGIRHIQFAALPKEDADAIDEYLKSLRAVPSPYLVNGKLSKSAKRGRKVFDKAGCDSCHKGPLYTDLQKYNVGTGKGLDKDSHFDTPTLVEVWRTAPYLYDGRAATMKDVLTTHNSDDKHGLTSNLSDSEIKDLAEFILSL